MTDATRRPTVTISDVKLGPVPPELPIPPHVRAYVDRMQRERIESRESRDMFISMGMNTKTANTLVNGGVRSVEDINRLGEIGLLTIPNLGQIKMAEIRLTMGWPAPTKPLYASLNADAMAAELRRRGWRAEPPSSKSDA